MPDATKAGELCSREVVVAERHLPLIKAAQLMGESHVGCLVIVEENGAGRRVVGMLTDRDIVVAVVAEAVDVGKVRVQDVMSVDPVIVQEDDPVRDVLGAMRRFGVRRLPVVTAEGALVGLVALDDVLPLLAGEMRSLAATIETELFRELDRVT